MLSEKTASHYLFSQILCFYVNFTYFRHFWLCYILSFILFLYIYKHIIWPIQLLYVKFCMLLCEISIHKNACNFLNFSSKSKKKVVLWSSDRWQSPQKNGIPLRSSKKTEKTEKTEKKGKKLITDLYISSFKSLNTDRIKEGFFQK